jgi:hypothetical protein
MFSLAICLDCLAHPLQHQHQNMRSPILLFLCLFSAFKLQAQPYYSDTFRNLGTIAQGAKIHFEITIYNRDTLDYNIQLKHICGCTEFQKSRYNIPAGSSVIIPIAYNSSGNSGKVERGFFVTYTDNKFPTQKIHFTAFVDTVKPFTTPAIDTGFCYRFDRTYIDMGEVPEGPHVKFVYNLYNCSTKPLIIRNVQSSCGCVTPKWPRETILPGETTEIITEYYTNGRPGFSQKTLLVTFENGDQVTLTLSCIVVAEDGKPTTPN